MIFSCHFLIFYQVFSGYRLAAPLFSRAREPWVVTWRERCRDVVSRHHGPSSPCWRSLRHSVVRLIPNSCAAWLREPPACSSASLSCDASFVRAAWALELPLAEPSARPARVVFAERGT